MQTLITNFVSRRFILIIAMFCLGVNLMYGAGTITATYIPTSIADNGGTGTTGYPFATFVTITGAAASSSYYIKIYNSSTNEYMWSGTQWSNTTTFSSANQPVVTTDASGGWKGWIYAKHNHTNSGTVNLRAALTTSTSTNFNQNGIAFTYLNVASGGTGGYVYRNTSPAVNEAVLAYSGGSIVGSYRTEDNSITEGYSYSSGGFEIAVPTGTIDSIVAYTDSGTRDQSFVGPWTVTAGNGTDVTNGGSGNGGAVGTAVMTPTFTSGLMSQTVTVKIYGGSGGTITNANVIVPSLWTWSETTGDVSATASAGTPSKAVSGDTIEITSLSLSATDSATVTISNISSPDSTLYTTFTVQTGISPGSNTTLSSNPRVYVHGSPRPISQVKTNDANGVNLLLGQYVTIEGVMTVTSQFNGAGYIQDNSGGIAIYDSSVTNHVNIGDEIIITGLMTQFDGLAEIDPVTLISTLSTGNTVTPLVVTCSQINNDGSGGVENYEGMLVQLDNVTVNTSTWTVSGAGSNYVLTDASGTAAIRVVPSVNYAGGSAPGSTPFDV
ncbi:MAG TPA: hypothetical protein VKS81_02105, partial [Bacteroidota bacterium]|nr:hypothetical protein [Bacteroidota bacterium]